MSGDGCEVIRTTCHGPFRVCGIECDVRSTRVIHDDWLANMRSCLRQFVQYRSYFISARAFVDLSIADVSGSRCASLVQGSAARVEIRARTDLCLNSDVSSRFCFAALKYLASCRSTTPASRYVRYRRMMGYRRIVCLRGKRFKHN